MTSAVTKTIIMGATGARPGAGAPAQQRQNSFSKMAAGPAAGHGRLHDLRACACWRNKVT